jgi:hypothetical protein
MTSGMQVEKRKCVWQTWRLDADAVPCTSSGKYDFDGRPYCRTHYERMIQITATRSQHRIVEAERAVIAAAKAWVLTKDDEPLSNRLADLRRLTNDLIKAED